MKNLFHLLMLLFKWAVFSVVDILMLLTVPVAAVLVSAFTSADAHGRQRYYWGWIWGTYDNPPQGDEGWVSKRCLFKGVTTGLKGYVNRVGWMLRNPMYGLAMKMGVNWYHGYYLKTFGAERVSDKDKFPGWQAAIGFNVVGKPIAFEFYLVAPWAETRDLRVRIGWKIMTDKVDKYGAAQFVNTINPFDGYGKSK